MNTSRSLSMVLVSATVICTLLCGCNEGGEGLSPSFDVSKENVVVFAGEGNGGSGLFLLDLNSKKVTKFIDTDVYETNPNFNSNGAIVVYSASEPGDKSSHIFIRSLDGKTSRQLTFGDSTYDSYPRFSPDGKMIVFTRAALHRPYSMGGYVWNDWDVFTMKADGSNVVRRTQVRYYQAYEPDFYASDSLIYTGDPGDNEYWVWQVDLSKSAKPTKLTEGSGSSCSRDGKMIAFISDRKVPFDYEVWIRDVKTKSEVQITHNKSYNEQPVFTHDGKHILFLSDPDRNSQPQLWRINTDGKGLDKIAGFELFADPMNWHP